MLCGSASREFYIDIGRLEEFYGVQYICNICVGHLGDLCDFPSPARLGVVERELAEVKDENFELQRQLDGLEQVKNGLLDLGLSIGDSGSFTSSGEQLVFSPLEDSGQDARAEQGEGSQHDPGEGTSPEQDDDEGVGELSGATALDESFGSGI